MIYCNRVPLQKDDNMALLHVDLQKHPVGSPDLAHKFRTSKMMKKNYLFDSCYK